MASKKRTPLTRSEIMQRIRSQETRPEVILRKRLWQAGVRYRKNLATLPGKPDIAITSARIAIFVDGSFWHGYKWEEKQRRLKTNASYWVSKIERNMRRDAENNDVLKQLGWVVLRFWDFEVLQNPDECVRRIIHTIELARTSGR